MKLDRAYQLELLEMLSESYPQCHDIRQHLSGMTKDAERRYEANMVYLDEHSLVECGIQFGIDGHSSYGLPRITNRGMDFLADDGGLGAILGVVTIKLHDDTLKELIAHRIQSSDLGPTDKAKWLGALRELPGETTKHLVLKLLDLGLDQASAAIESIGKYLGM